MNYFYCFHRPGRLHGSTRLCKHCGVAVEECACVSWGRSVRPECPACEGSGWVGIVRSKAAGLEQMLLGPRITGGPEFYSVAEHCCRVADLVPGEDQLWALLHDAAEAYLVDLPRPLDVNERNLLAWRDGFRGNGRDGAFAEMLEFWTGRLPFQGHIIHWRYDAKKRSAKCQTR